MHSHSQFINVDGVSLHVADWGGNGPDLLLLHANGFCGHVYQLMLAGLIEHYHILTMDLRGQGDSEKCPPGSYHWQALARDVEGVIEHLGLQDFYAIGHSGGAALLALYAAIHPGRVKRLVLMEPVCFPHEADFLANFSVNNHLMVERARRRRVVWDSREQVLVAYRGKEIFAGWRNEVLKDYIEHGTGVLPDGRVALKCSGEAEAEVFVNSTSLDIFSQLHRVDCRALVLRGQHTDPPLFTVAERVAQRIPHGTLITVPDTSHFLPMEKPGEVGMLIDEFLRGA